MDLGRPWSSRDELSASDDLRSIWAHMDGIVKLLASRATIGRDTPTSRRRRLRRRDLPLHSREKSRPVNESDSGRWRQLRDGRPRHATVDGGRLLGPVEVPQSAQSAVT
jgi:hypothetical protein